METYYGEISRLWFLLFFRGLVAIAVGLVAFFLPEVTLQALGWLFGVFAFLLGLLDLVRAFRTRPYFDRWWIFLLQGVLALAFALATFFFPYLPLYLILVLIGLWLLLYGGLAFWFALLMRRLGGDWLLPLTLSALSFLLILLFILWPEVTLKVLLWLFGTYALLTGLLDILQAIRLLRRPARWVILINTRL